ncbi:MAG: flavin monoamine oxidase family protein [Planctomycetaceae bacterium]
MGTCAVAIVGGGPGGLMTAHALERESRTPVAITIYEATHRLGGKVWTRSFDRLPARYEAGAAEFYDYSGVGPDPLKELVRDLGLSITPLGGSALLADGRLLATIDDVRDVLGPAAADALERFDRAAHDAVGPHDFYRGERGPHAALLDVGFDALLAEVRHPAARRYIERLIHSDLATEPARTTAAYGLDNYLMNDPAYLRLYAIEGGNERLVTALDGGIRATRRLGHRVTGVGTAAGGRLRVTADRDGLGREDDFDVVVIALPVEHLERIEFAGPRLAEALHRHVAHHDHPADYLRVTILFDRPFWRPWLADDFTMLDAFGGCCLYDESARHPGAAHGTLGWLLGGDAARELSGLGDDELVAAALDSLPAALAPGRRHMLEGRVHRWIGAVSGMPGGPAPWPVDRRHRPEPVDHPHLFVVGDYLFDSTLNGVLDSAEHVAGWIADLAAARHGARP